MGDGTFSRAVKFFYQLYSIHGFINGHYVLLVFFPLADKQQLGYERMLQYMEEEAQKLGVSIEPETMLFDFEKAAHNAASTVLGCKIRGCKFHHSQALQRFIQQVPHLRKAYSLPSTKDVDGRFVRHEKRDWLVSFLGLSSLPADKVPDALHLLIDNIPDFDYFSQFSDYVLEEYVDAGCRFPPSLWAFEPDELLPTTTNGAESFHADFNRQFGSAHPNVHASLQVLREVQSQTYIKMQSVEKGDIHRRKPKVVQRIARRVEAWREVKEGKRTMLSYVKLVGYMTKARSKII